MNIKISVQGSFGEKVDPFMPLATTDILEIYFVRKHVLINVSWTNVNQNSINNSSDFGPMLYPSVLTKVS